MKTDFIRKKILSIFLCLIIIVTSGNIHIYGNNSTTSAKNPYSFDFTPGVISSGYQAPSLNDNINLSSDLATAPMPSHYSSVELGYITSVKNQYSLGTCWAFAAIASMEAYALSHGLVNSPADIDLSEYALAYMTFDDRSYQDPLGGTAGDYTAPLDGSSLSNAMYHGGNDELAFKTLSKWAGIVNEADAPYSALIPDYTFNSGDVSYILTGQYYISMKDRELVKKAIMENGAVASSYYSDAMYYNNHYNYSTHETYYGYYNYNYKTKSINHAIAIVGWDDSIDKSLFTMTDSQGNTHTPAENGAWLVKNSWGVSSGKDGYIWISYCDMGMSAMNAVIYEIAPADKYDYNYQHDGSTIFAKDSGSLWSNKYANVFNTNSSSGISLDAVSFATRQANRGYSIQLYKNPDSNNPESGTPLLSSPLTGMTTYAGYYTIELPYSIELAASDSFAVVITFDEYTILEESLSYNYVGSDCYSVNAYGTNQSYFYSNQGKYYIDMSMYKLNFCIKAFASDISADITSPDILNISQLSLNKAEITWKNLSSASGYELYRADSINGSYSLIYSGNASAYTDNDVDYGNTYYYKLRAYDSNTLYSDYSSPKLITISVPATFITDISSDGNGIQLSWKSIENADSYRLYRSSDGISYTLITTTDKLTYFDSDIKYNTTYYYQLKTCMNIGGTVEESFSSPVASGQKTLSSPSINKYDDEIHNRISLGWSFVEHASGYTIYRTVFDYSVNQYVEYNNKVADLDSATLSFTDDISGFSGGMSIMYTVYPYIREDGEIKTGTGSNRGSVIRYAPLDNINWKVTGSRLALTWDSCDYDLGISGYYIVYISSDINGSYTKLTKYADSGDTQTLLLSEAYKPGSTYYVKICAYFNNNLTRKFITSIQETPERIGGSITPPVLSKLPDLTVAKASKNKFTISVSNTDSYADYSYQWYVTDNPYKSGNAISGSTGSSYTPSTTDIGKKYYYCIITVSYGPYVRTFKSNTAAVLVQTPISGQSISIGSSYTYTGNAITPSPVIKNGSKLLVNGTDYRLSYSNNVNPGTASITITGLNCYSGSTTITFKITKAEPVITPPSSVTSSVTYVNAATGSISKITAGTSVSSVLSTINEKAYCVIQKNGSNVSASVTAATGMKLCIINGGSTLKSYYIIVTGDTNGDGKINITDMIAVKQNILGKAALSGAYKSAADVNGDGKINITDFIKIKAAILGKDSISGIAAK